MYEKDQVINYMGLNFRIGGTPTPHQPSGTPTDNGNGWQVHGNNDIPFCHVPKGNEQASHIVCLPQPAVEEQIANGLGYKIDNFVGVCKNHVNQPCPGEKAKPTETSTMVPKPTATGTALPVLNVGSTGAETTSQEKVEKGAIRKALYQPRIPYTDEAANSHNHVFMPEVKPIQSDGADLFGIIVIGFVGVATMANEVVKRLRHQARSRK